MQEAKTYTMQQISVELGVHYDTVRNCLKRSGYQGILSGKGHHLLFSQEAFDHVKNIYKTKIEIVEVPVFVEVHHNWEIKESKMSDKGKEILQELEDYFANNTKEQVLKDWEEARKKASALNDKGATVTDFIEQNTMKRYK